MVLEQVVIEGEVMVEALAELDAEAIDLVDSRVESAEVAGPAVPTGAVLALDYQRIMSMILKCATCMVPIGSPEPCGVRTSA
ncbi:hypothetical protein ACWD9K_32830 [Streptomyces sp. 900116325]